MMLVILMQRPKSEGLGAAFGGAVTENLFGAQTTLFHLGVLDAPPRKSNHDRSAERAAAWAEYVR